jgi:hypothetical protein
MTEVFNIYERARARGQVFIFGVLSQDPEAACSSGHASS